MRFAADPSVTAIVMGACSECAMEAAPVANDKAVPLISLAPGDAGHHAGREPAVRLQDRPERRRRLRAPMADRDGPRPGSAPSGWSHRRTRTVTTAATTMTREAAKADITVAGSGPLPADRPTCAPRRAPRSAAQAERRRDLVGTGPGGPGRRRRARGGPPRPALPRQRRRRQPVPVRTVGGRRGRDARVPADPRDGRRHRHHAGQGGPQAVVRGLHLPVRRLPRAVVVRRRRARRWSSPRSTGPADRTARRCATSWSRWRPTA